MIPCIIIPVYNTYDKLVRCIESLDVPVDNLLIINNGDGVVDVPVRAKNQVVLDMPSNLGVGPAWNLGIKCFPYLPGWVVLNSDAWFEPGAAQHFAWFFDRRNIVLAGDPGWCCAWIGDEVIRQVGLFSECYVPAYFEDVDFEARAVARGFDVVRTDAAVNHENSSTVKHDDVINSMHLGRFHSNRKHHNLRWKSGVPSAGEWMLDRRRKLGWDAPR